MEEGRKQTKKRNLNFSSPAPKNLLSISTPNPTKTPQRVLGDKVRKQTLKHKNQEIEQIKEENVELKREVSKLEDENFEKDRTRGRN